MFRRYAALPAAFFAAVLLAALPSPALALDTVRTETGLRYADEKIGAGRAAKPGEIAIVHYTGWLSDFGDKGTEFDTSRNGRPFSFRIGGGRVIKAWDEGVAGMRIGGKRTLLVPSELGYGESGAGRGKIPPGADLIFEVELVDLR